MTLKLVLISPEGTLIDEDNKLVGTHVAGICKLISLLSAHGIQVAIWTNRRWEVNGKEGLDTYFTRKSGCEVAVVGPGAGREYVARSRAGSVLPILKKFDVSSSETILVGNGKEDLRAGVNNRLLLLRPNWYRTDIGYGMPIDSVSSLARFCIVFGLRRHPIYWRIEADGLEAMAMGPFSTRLQAYRGFGEDAFQAAKFERGTRDFWHHALVSTLYFSGLTDDFDLIARYPGHSPQHQEKAIDEVMVLLAKCFRVKFYPDLIVRHTTAQKSAYLRSNQKTFANQLNTIRLNRRPLAYGTKPEAKDIRLAGKRVLVVDDICTNGRSLESARAYIEAAGGAAILFSWLKTINTDFYQLAESVQLLPFDANEIRTEPQVVSHPYSANIVDSEAASEIAALLDQYNSWSF